MKALAGRRIVVTRPAGQSGHLAGLIRAVGGEPVLFPTIEIRDVADSGPLAALIDRLDEFDMAVFVSPNAVEKAMGLATRGWPARLHAATVGRGSVAALRRFGTTS